MQSRPPTFSRRRALSGAAALAAVLGATTMTSAACGTTEPPPADLDDLTTALERARADSRLATTAAAVPKSPVDVLTEVASERSAHAEALTEEIARMTGNAAPTTTTTSAASSSTALPAPTVDDVIGALEVSAASAAEAAGELTGYRAGLLGSIAAACTALYSVALNPPGGAR